MTMKTGHPQMRSETFQGKHYLLTVFCFCFFLVGRVGLLSAMKTHFCSADERPWKVPLRPDSDLQAAQVNEKVL